jgi:hypothetical protein
VTPPAETQPMAEAQPQPQPEVAEAAPPPAPAPPAPAPEPAPQQPPANLPTTASLYPLIGLSGLFSLGLYGLLRLKRMA